MVVLVVAAVGAFVGLYEIDFGCQCQITASAVVVVVLSALDVPRPR